MVTGLVRDYIIAIANQLNDRGYNFYSATTDGFISDVPFEVLESLDAYGFTDLFKEARMYLTEIQQFGARSINRIHYCSILRQEGM